MRKRRYQNILIVKQNLLGLYAGCHWLWVGLGRFCIGHALAMGLQSMVLCTSAIYGETLAQCRGTSPRLAFPFLTSSFMFWAEQIEMDPPRQRGKPRIEIDVEYVEQLLNARYKMQDVANHPGVISLKQNGLFHFTQAVIVFLCNQLYTSIKQSCLTFRCTPGPQITLLVTFSHIHPCLYSLLVLVDPTV